MDDLNSGSTPNSEINATGIWNGANPGQDRDAILTAAQMAVRDTSRLTRVLSILGDPAPIDDLLGRVLSALSELFLADIVILLDPIGHGTYLPLAAIGLPEKVMETAFSHEPGSCLAQLLETGKLINNIELGLEHTDHGPLRDLGVKTCLWLPILSGDVFRGALVLARCKPIAYDESEIGLLSALAQRIGLALDQASRNQQLEEIIDSQRDIARDLKETSVLSRVVSRFLTLTGADSSAVFLQNDDGKLYCASRLNLQPERGDHFAQMIEGLVFSGEFSNARTLDLVELLDLTTHRRVEIPASQLPRISLIVPLLRADKVIGALAAFRFSVGAFLPNVLPAAMLFANQTTAAIRNARLYKSVKEELAERMALSEALQSREERFRSLIHSVSDVISIITIDGKFLFLSPAVKAAWGFDPDELIGQSVFDQVSPDDHKKVKDVLSSFPKTDTEMHLRSIKMRYGEDSWKDFEVTFTNQTSVTAVKGVVATFHDVTERRVYEHRLKDMAYHDELTGLPNRKFFEETLVKALDLTRNTGLMVVVVFLDLDSFKLINDSMGHMWGDKLLCLVAERLKGFLRREDPAARMGGDEFTILLEGISSREQVIPILERFIDAFNEPIFLNGRDVYIGGSFGAVIGRSPDSVVDLLRKADMAMYQAKNRGKGGFVLFDSENQPPGLDQEASDQMMAQSEFHRAFSQQEFRAAYTPVYTLNNLQEKAFEAQLNWMHPQRGRLMLLDFMAAAYKAGMMGNAGRWLSREVFRQMNLWNKSSRVPVCLRFPARFVLLADFPSWLGDLKKEFAIDPTQIIVDILADDSANTPERLIPRLQSLKQIGFQLAISGYGVNFAGINLFSHMPIDFIRMDMSAFRDLDPKPISAILDGTYRVAQAFGIRTIIGGIDSKEQVELLHSFGYNLGLGNALSGPLLPEEIESRHLLGL